MCMRANSNCQSWSVNRCARSRRTCSRKPQATEQQQGRAVGSSTALFSIGHRHLDVPPTRFLRRLPAERFKAAPIFSTGPDPWHAGCANRLRAGAPVGSRLSQYAVVAAQRRASQACLPTGPSGSVVGSDPSPWALGEGSAVPSQELRKGSGPKMNHFAHACRTWINGATTDIQKGR